MDFNEILLEKVEEEYQEKRKRIINHSDQLKFHLIRIAQAGRWTLTTNVMGTGVYHPEEEKDLNLLEKCGLVNSKTKYTKHNSYLEYSITEKGRSVIDNPQKEI